LTTKPPIFSVVIPTHNRAGVIERALRSVAAQTCADYEVIVIDDGSTDATPTVLQSVQSPAFRLFRHEKARGVSAARNHGVAEATGELVTFLDDDDELRPEAFEALLERYRAGPVDFLWGGRCTHECDAEGRLIATREDDWSAVPFVVSGSSVLPYVLATATNSAFTIRRSVFTGLGGFDEGLRVSEDRDLLIRLAQAGLAGAAVARTIMDVNEGFRSLSRNGHASSGSDVDLRVIDKHRVFLERPEHQAFLNRYLSIIFLNFLEAGNRRSAMGMLGELWRRKAVNFGLVRSYMRHAPEFRALKSLFRYDSIRRFRHRLRKRPGED
jgi:glycosyltransferase involved in cell wall biosynthesis